ncbi:hypothetical protein K466DRAFT_580911 [Polyporus arcularius HHB13444]|uniref:Uncharacterized protein n=1 Tax=Polyporus arcularius HHB13444 TaxID=1314778 RepID=A0A5C3PVG8_9APHY|nr:hypothetical protein K466DRAFT_580911 [Polyporus arcularius HHB13444]
MNDSNDNVTAVGSTSASVEDLPRSHVPVALDMGTQSVSPGLSSGETSPSDSHEALDHVDGGASVPPSAVASVAPTLPLSLGANAIISMNDVDDYDDDDDLFSPKGPPAGAEHGIKKPVKPIKKIEVVSSNDVDDDDEDDDWFSPKGPPSGAEQGIRKPVKPIKK